MSGPEMLLWRVVLQGSIAIGIALLGAELAARSGAAAAPAPKPRAQSAPPDSAPAAALARAVAEREYWAGASARGLQAPNRRHALRTYFGHGGIRVHDRSDPAESMLLGLTVRGLGRGSELEPVPPGRVEALGARVEIRREGFIEWYLNSEQGLEQGFTLVRQPADEGEVIVELAVSGARVADSGAALRLTAESGRVLEYGSLHAIDARGEALRARLERRGADRIALVVDDRGAHYPITLDPLLSATADAQFEPDQVSALLGTSITSAGDVNGDGYADVLFGATDYDAGQSNEGAAFLFLGSASGIASGIAGGATGAGGAEAALIQSNQANAHLGDVAGAGDVNGDGYSDVIVGADSYDNGHSDEGAAFVFLGSATGISDGDPNSAHAQFEANQTSALLGGSVAGAGDVNGDGFADVIVGAETYDNGSTDEGAAFLFLGSATGMSDGSPTNAHARFEANRSVSLFGIVAGAGDVDGDGFDDVLVGAPEYDNGQTDEGAAFLFRGSASGITNGSPSTANALFESDQASAFLGTSVAGAGDINGDGYADVLVGAEEYNAPESNEGVVLAFLGSATGIANGNPGNAHAQFESNQIGALLGVSAAGIGDVNGDGYADIAVGADAWDNGQADEGAVFVFLGSATGIADGAPATAAAQLELNQTGAGLAGVAAAGDVNGDGYADLIAGAEFYDAPSFNEGVAVLYYGAASGIADGTPATSATRLEVDQVDSGFAENLAIAGDVNGDGYSDLIVGAERYDSGQADEGAAFIFLGSASGIADASVGAAAARLESDQAGALFGTSVAGAGDVNGDGYGDVLVGAEEWDGPAADAGAAFVFLGSATGIASEAAAAADARFESEQSGSLFGGSVAGVGDVNGDGYADVIVGAEGYDAGEVDEGAAFVFHGSITGIANQTEASAAAQLEASQAGALLGGSVAGAGDVNGDGYADVLVDAQAYDAGEVDEGAAFVFHGSASGIGDGSPASAATELQSNQAGASFGGSLAGAGDVNGDGYSDVIVGADLFDSGQADEGAAFVFHGSATGVDDATPAAQLESDQASAAFGECAAGAGDVNGDGYADVIVGSVFYDAGQSDEGAAFVFHGSATGVSDGTPLTAATQLESNQVNGFLDACATGTGDVNGDGYADVGVGARGLAGASGEGAALVFLGNGDGDGRPVRAQQRRGDASAVPAQPWGRSGEEDRFEVSLTATHPAGRGRVKLEIEACPAALAFGDPQCTRQVGASWTDSTASAAGVPLVELVTVPDARTLHRWRARVLYAPFRVTQVGVTPPPKPAHGPWRRVQAQSIEADIYVPEPSGPGLLIAGGVMLGMLGLRRRAVLAAALGLGIASGCATGSGSSHAVDAENAALERRVAQLERELAELRAEATAQRDGAAAREVAPAQAPGALVAKTEIAAVAAGPPQATATNAPAAGTAAPLQVPTWNVTPDITFKPGARLQVRYLHESFTDNNEIAIQRFRLKGAGQAWKAKYGLELKIDNTGRTGANPSAAVENGWIEYPLLPSLAARAGLYDVPFSRDALTSDSKLLFMDRSLIKDALTSFGLADNGIGALAHGRPLGGHLEYALGVFNNDRFDGLGTSSRRTGSLMPVARFGVDLLDPEAPGGYADYRESYVGSGKRLGLGVNGAWLQHGRNGAQRFDLYAWGADLFFNYGPYTLQGEYDWFRLTGNVDRSNRGWFAQGAYLIEPLRDCLKDSAPWFPLLEVAARYQDLDAESFSPNRERRASIGLNTYFRDHNLKLQTEYSFRELTGRPDGNLFQTQLQLDF
jgi:hypothetical protein